jgi:dihydropteroate synthase
VAGLAYAAERGAHVLRVHDVRESCDAARLLEALRREEDGRA